ncbi:DUF4132 domain-containing protein [Paenarthrobacter nicotinovorans]|uniref:DUF4132 domain-containing protein n=1 Tax=Paenarthrobacter nicotinovorans TaxID=29320 RepID=A0ABV0GT18_PAENI|nr:DUF4132 domain-containing protein [Paenarthrobacter nicotinovorans]
MTAVWLDTSTEYKIGVADGKVVAQNKAGKIVKTVPAALKDDEATLRLRAFVEWTATHQRECGEQVQDWMVRSLPVATTLVRELWLDESWRVWLRDAVVLPCTSDGSVVAGAQGGFLRDVSTADGTVGLVTLDGETEYHPYSYILLPHPVLLGSERDDYRDFAAELGIVQKLRQLMRETFDSGNRDGADTEVRDYANASFEQLSHLTSRARSLGYLVRGGFCQLTVSESGRTVHARVWIGAEDPAYPAETGPLFWQEGDTVLPLGSVGPVAFSEGMAMAAGLYAGRTIEAEGEDA